MKVREAALCQIQRLAIAGDAGVDPVHGVDHELRKGQHSLVAGLLQHPALVDAVQVAADQTFAGIALVKIAPKAGILVAEEKIDSAA